MIIWSRMGFLVAVFVFACNLLLAVVLDSLFGGDYFGKHPWAVGAGFIMGGLLSSAVGFAIRPRGGRQVIDAQTRKRFVIRDPDHTFFFIPMHWAGLVVAGIGVVMAIGELFVPAPKGEPALADARDRQAPAVVATIPWRECAGSGRHARRLPAGRRNPNPAPVFNPKALNPFAAGQHPLNRRQTPLSHLLSPHNRRPSLWTTARSAATGSRRSRGRSVCCGRPRTSRTGHRPDRAPWQHSRGNTRGRGG
jgi:hypothetical protein